MIRAVLPFAVVLWLVAGASNQSSAALIDRGNGLIFDDDINITWLQDGNFAKTSGFSDTLPTAFFNQGRMTFFEASAWIEDLVYEELDDWRLPTQTEMEHLFFSEFGFVRRNQPGWIPGNENMEPFFNVGGGHYWALNPGDVFNFNEGFSNTGSSLDLNIFRALPVRDGDIITVPEPSSVGLFVIGLAGLSLLHRRRLKVFDAM